MVGIGHLYPGRFKSFPVQTDALVDNILEAEDCERIEKCVKRGQPFGNSDWVMQTVRRLCLESTLKPRGNSNQR